MYIPFCVLFFLCTKGEFLKMNAINIMSTSNYTQQKPTNRTIQRTHSTYKNKSQISEALHLIKPYVSQSTYKYLSHFLYTEGTGATQSKVTTICKKTGTSTSTYSDTINPEIQSTFAESLIIAIPQTKK